MSSLTESLKNIRTYCANNDLDAYVYVLRETIEAIGSRDKLSEFMREKFNFEAGDPTNRVIELLSAHHKNIRECSGAINAVVNPENSPKGLINFNATTVPFEQIDNMEFLAWLHNRLINIYGENQNTDFVKRLRTIVEALTAPTPWYDYDNFRVLKAPPAYIDCEIMDEADNSWHRAITVSDYENGVVCNVTSWGAAEYHKFEYPKVRPLDWDKNISKPVDIEWFMGSIFDMDFLIEGIVPWVGKLGKIKTRGNRWFYDTNELKATQCKPRMSPFLHHVAPEDVDNIPEGFNYNVGEGLINGQPFMVVEFTGLKPGYHYTWENDQ